LLGLVRLPGLTGSSDCPDFIILSLMIDRDEVVREAPLMAAPRLLFSWIVEPTHSAIGRCWRRAALNASATTLMS
jgi:hypothetical protein